MMTGKVMRLYALVLVLLMPGRILPQQILNDHVIQTMKQDIALLASDSLEGREAGSMGELHAAVYIAERMEMLGLKPWFNGCYYQDFDFPDGVEYLPDYNFIKKVSSIGENTFLSEPRETDAFTPLPWGKDGHVLAEVVNAGYCLEGFMTDNTGNQRKKNRRNNENATQEADWQGKIFLARVDLPPGVDGSNKAVIRIMMEKVNYAESLGAAAVMFYDPAGYVSRVPGNYYFYEDAGIPVVFIHDPEVAKWLVSPLVEVYVESQKKRGIGKNVVAWIDNGADQTIVIGAHFDHLGWGMGNSRHEGNPAIHPGADDNASGVAGMLALAEYLVRSDLKNRNYLFAAFSAEEKGLIGSRVFVEDTSISRDNIIAMLNYDMIGRVDPVNPEIRLLASGSSSRWEELLALVSEDVTAVPSEGGLSGSDHHYFYQEEIPVLFFFNGLHEDYHKPSDVIEKINFLGLRDVVEYTIHLLSVLDTIQNLPFQRVPEQSQGSRRGGQFSLGIIPAHGADVIGVKVEEVLHERPAEVAGMLRGDIVVNIAGTEVKNMADYMSALGRIEAGQQIEVTVIRDNLPVKLTLQF
ncbi:MAG: M28 family peptidase [Bacteroidales bacterium]